MEGFSIEDSVKNSFFISINYVINKLIKACVFPLCRIEFNGRKWWWWFCLRLLIESQIIGRLLFFRYHCKSYSLPPLVKFSHSLITLLLVPLLKRSKLILERIELILTCFVAFEKNRWFCF